MGTLLGWIQYKVQIHTTPNVENEMQYTGVQRACLICVHSNVNFCLWSSAYTVVAEYHLKEGGINDLLVLESVFKLVNATLKIA